MNWRREKKPGPFTREELELFRRKFTNPGPQPCMFAVSEQEMYRLLATVDQAIDRMNPREADPC